MGKLKERAQKVLSKQLYKSTYSRAFFTLYGVVLKEIRCSFKQFFTWKSPVKSFFRVCSVLLSAFLRLVLGRSVKLSFAFTGEDRLLEGIFKPLITHQGFYVEVGCNHPVFLSNTYGFYRKGWRGICVDANQKMIDKFAYYRPKDTAVTALVSDLEEKRDFYVVQNDVLSTTEIENVELAEQEGLSYEKTQVQTRSLTNILDNNNAPNQIDILSVDAEEHDLHVLKSLDFSRYEPTVIIVEDETFEFLKPDENEIYQFVVSQGYELVGFVLTNLYFKKRLVHCSVSSNHEI